MFLEDAKSDVDFSLGKKKFKHYIKDYKQRRGLDCEETYPEMSEFIKNIK